MKASTKRIFSILISISMLIGSLFIYTSLIRPIYSQIKDLRIEVASRLDFIAKHETYIQQVQKLLSEYQDIAKIIETTSLILPLEPDVAFGVNQIAGLSKFYNLTIELLGVQQLAITPSSQPNSIKGLGTLRFNFRLMGSYESFKSFLQALETNITLMDLMNLKTEPATQTKAAGNNFYYTMVVDTYYQAE